MTTAKTTVQNNCHCASLPADGYAFHFLQALRTIHAKKGNFAPVQLQEVLELLPETFHNHDLYEKIEPLYDQEIIASYYGKEFFLTEKYR